MNIRMRAAAIAVAAAGALGLGVLGAGSALAGTGMVTVVTHTMNHPDTTSVRSPCTLAGEVGGGPVWAYDNLSLRLVTTPAGSAGTYNVTIYAHGSFDAVCDPITGGPMTGHGSVDGSYHLTVVSANGPVGSVPAQQPDGTTGQGAIVGQLFPDATSITGGDYSYTYNRVDGTKYQQSS
jgi:hypothetical protein